MTPARLSSSRNEILCSHLQLRRSPSKPKSFRSTVEATGLRERGSRGLNRPGRVGPIDPDGIFVPSHDFRARLATRLMKGVGKLGASQSWRAINWASSSPTPRRAELGAKFAFRVSGSPTGCSVKLMRVRTGDAYNYNTNEGDHARTPVPVLVYDISSLFGAKRVR